MAEVSFFTVGAIGFTMFVLLAGSITGLVIVWRGHRAGTL